MEFPEQLSLSSISNASIFTAATSLSASVILLRSVTAGLIPDFLYDYFSTRLHTLSARFSSYLTVVIEECEGFTPNQMFDAAVVFLGTKISPATRRIRVMKPQKDEELTVSIDRNEEIYDSYDGVTVNWILRSVAINAANAKLFGKSKEERFSSLGFIRNTGKSYLQYILKRSEEIKAQNRAVKLHTLAERGAGYWTSVALNHPASFSTIAMEASMKEEIIADLEKFINRKDYYRRVGRAWKRGYLLYGPPGTGKSSLIAAIANHLKFDVYDLDLKDVNGNSDLRSLLIGTANRSILVIEDIDCSISLLNREPRKDRKDNDKDEDEDDDDDNNEDKNEKITLSGLLNFIDGLWSSCGDERIIVFTTNHKDRLDPALLRPGRMDLHIEMSYCTFDGFRVLARNYLSIEDHTLFPEIEALLSNVEVTPAEVAGELMKSDDVDAALGNLITFIRHKEQTGMNSTSMTRHKEHTGMNSMSVTKFKRKKRRLRFS